MRLGASWKSRPERCVFTEETCIQNCRSGLRESCFQSLLMRWFQVGLLSQQASRKQRMAACSYALAPKQPCALVGQSIRVTFELMHFQQHSCGFLSARGCFRPDALRTVNWSKESAQGSKPHLAVACLNGRLGSTWQICFTKHHARHCQNKPPCRDACWTLATQPCPILYLSAISKPALRLSNLQLCCM